MSANQSLPLVDRCGILPVSGGCERKNEPWECELHGTLPATYDSQNRSELSAYAERTKIVRTVYRRRSYLVMNLAAFSIPIYQYPPSHRYSVRPLIGTESGANPG